MKVCTSMSRPSSMRLTRMLSLSVLLLVLLVSFVLSSVQAQSATEILYMVGDVTDNLYTLDTSTGTATRVGEVNQFGVSEDQPRDLAGCPNGNLYLLGDDNDVLYLVNTGTGVATQVGSASEFGVSEHRPRGLACTDSGILYFLGDITNALYTLNTGTGVATRVDSTTFKFGLNLNQPWGLAAIGEDLYAFFIENNNVYTIDTTTGAATLLGGSGISGLLTGFGGVGNTLYATSYTGTDALYTISTTDGTATRVGTASSFGVEEGEATGLGAAVESIPAPGVPGNFRVTNINGHNMTVSWETATGTVTGYDVDYRESSTVSWNHAADTASTTRSYTEFNLLVSTEYSWRIRAQNSSGFGDWSAVITGTTDSIPGAPTDLAVTASATLGVLDITLTVADDGGGTISHVHTAIRRRTESIWPAATVVAGTYAPYSSIVFDDAVRRDVRVRLQTEAGIGPWSTTVSATPRARPSTPLVTLMPGTNQLTVNWQTTSDDYILTAQTVEYELNGSGTWSSVSGITSTVTSAVIDGLIGDTSYRIRVTGTNAYGTSDYGYQIASPASPIAGSIVSAEAIDIMSLDAVVEVRLANPDSQPTTVYVRHKQASAPSWSSTISQTTTSDHIPFDIDSLIQNTEYQVEVSLSDTFTTSIAFSFTTRIDVRHRLFFVDFTPKTLWEIGDLSNISGTEYSLGNLPAALTGPRSMGFFEGTMYIADNNDRELWGTEDPDNPSSFSIRCTFTTSFGNDIHSLVAQEGIFYGLTGTAVYSIDPTDCSTVLQGQLHSGITVLRGASVYNNQLYTFDHSGNELTRIPDITNPGTYTYHQSVSGIGNPRAMATYRERLLVNSESSRAIYEIINPESNSPSITLLGNYGSSQGTVNGMTEMSTEGLYLSPTPPSVVEVDNSQEFILYSGDNIQQAIISTPANTYMSLATTESALSCSPQNTSITINASLNISIWVKYCNAGSTTLSIKDTQNNRIGHDYSIQINPRVEHAPNFVGSSATRSVDENSAAGTEVGLPIMATDANTGDSITYSLSGTEATSFAVDNTGQITVSASAVLNYEIKSSYTFTLTASDGSLTDSISVTVNLNDVSDAPHIYPNPSTQDSIINTNQLFSVLIIGDGVSSAVITKVSGTGDIDLASTEAGLSCSGSVLDLVTITVPGSFYIRYCSLGSVTVRVADSGVSTNNRDYSITVVPVPNVAPEFVGSSATRSVDENSAAGTEVGLPIMATDANTGDSITYSLSGTEATSFAVDNTGQITVSASAVLNYEIKSSYTFTLTASDGSLTDSISVTVNLNDVYEAAAPTITPDPSTFDAIYNDAQFFTLVNTEDSITDVTLTVTAGTGDMAISSPGFPVCTGTINRSITGLSPSGSFWARFCTVGMLTLRVSDTNDATVYRDYAVAIRSLATVLVTAITVTDITNTGANITVSYTNPDASASTPVYMRYKKTSESQWTTPSPTFMTTGTDTSKTWSISLDSNTEYQVEARAENQNWAESSTLSTTLTTDPDPAAITSVTVTDITSTSANVSIVLTNEGNLSTTVYLRSKTPASAATWNGPTDSVVTSGTSASIALTNLPNQTEYTVQVSTSNSYPAGSTASRTFTTLGNIALTPMPSSISRLSNLEFSISASSDIQNVIISQSAGTGSISIAETEAGLNCSNLVASMTLQSSATVWVRGCTTGTVTLSATDVNHASVTASYSITITSALAVLTSVSVGIFDSNSVTVTSSIVNPDAQSISVSFSIRTPRGTGTYGSVNTQTVTGTSVGYTFTGLESNTEYEIRACDQLACNGVVVTASFTTVAAPRRVTTISSMEITSVSATIDVILDNEDSVTTQVYLRYRVTSSADYTELSPLTTSGLTVTFNLSGLTRNTSYTVQASLATDYSNAATSAFTTRSPTLTAVTIGSKTRTTAWINLEISYSDNNEETYYVRYRTPSTTGTYGSTLTLTGSGDVISYRLTNLSEYSTYRLEASTSSVFPLDSRVFVFFTTLANQAPVFNSDSIIYEVPESTPPDSLVGTPITAIDPEDDAIIYSLSGDAIDQFKVQNTGQILVKDSVIPLYSVQTTYIVVLTATDTDGLSDSITVTIEVRPFRVPTAVPTPFALSKPENVRVIQAALDVYVVTWDYVYIPSNAAIICEWSADQTNWMPFNINPITSTDKKVSCQQNLESESTKSNYPDRYRIRVRMYSQSDPDSELYSSEAFRLPSDVTGFVENTPIPASVSGTIRDMKFVIEEGYGYLYPTEPLGSIVLFARYRASAGADYANLPVISKVVGLDIQGLGTETSILAIRDYDLAGGNVNKLVKADYPLPVLFVRPFESELGSQFSITRSSISWRHSLSENQYYNLQLRSNNLDLTVDSWIPDLENDIEGDLVTYTFDSPIATSTIGYVHVVIREQDDAGQVSEISVDNRVDFNTGSLSETQALTLDSDQNRAQSPDLGTYQFGSVPWVSSWGYREVRKSIFHTVNNGWGEGIILIYIPQVYLWNNFDFLNTVQKVWSIQAALNPIYAYEQFSTETKEKRIIIQRIAGTQDADLLIKWLNELYTDAEGWNEAPLVEAGQITERGTRYLSGALPNFQEIIGGLISDFGSGPLSIESDIDNTTEVPDDAIKRGLFGLNTLLGMESGPFMMYIVVSAVCLGAGFIGSKLTGSPLIAILGAVLAFIFAGLLGIVPGWVLYVTGIICVIVLLFFMYLRRG